MTCTTEFVQHIEKLFDESVLIGSGWTTYESLRYVSAEHFLYISVFPIASLCY